jgi:hypothetical protein
MENCTIYRGHARFESAHEVSVGAERLRAEKIFINVGGRALVPDMPGIGEIDFLTNSSMMSVDYLPKHLIVIGGSYIGLEFGQMFRRFGSELGRDLRQVPRNAPSGWARACARHEFPDGRILNDWGCGPLHHASGLLSTRLEEVALWDDWGASSRSSREPRAGSAGR